MKRKPSDMPGAKKAVTAAVGDVDAEGNTIVAEGHFDDDGNAVIDAELADEVQDPAPETYRTFTDQAIALVGSPTSDGRMLAKDIELTFRSFPLPLMWCEKSGMGHMDAFTIGVMETARVDGDKVLASGYILNTEDADRWYNIAAHGVSNASVDLADADYVYTDADGNEIDSDDLFEKMMEGEEFYITFTKAELIGTTFVATPAFDTRIQLNSERETRNVSIVASAKQAFQPKTYDHRLFSDPQLSGPTLPTIGEDGRIYGHLARFGQCHTAVQDQCILVPRSPSGYSRFHTSPAVRLDNGERLPVGRLTVGTGHADQRLGGSPAAAHYDNTGTCFALVRVGEDSHGIWFSGVAAPWATTEQIEQGLSAPLSGDWRDFGQGLELVAALAVNTPGFSVRGRDDEDGVPIALVASGRLSPKTKRGGMRLARNELKAIVSEAVTETLARERAMVARDRALAAAAKVKLDVAVDVSDTKARIEGLLAKFDETPPADKKKKKPKGADTTVKPGQPKVIVTAP